MIVTLLTSGLQHDKKKSCNIRLLTFSCKIVPRESQQNKHKYSFGANKSYLECSFGIYEMLVSISVIHLTACRMEIKKAEPPAESTKYGTI